MRLTARVPATAANLGPGFDCLGLALDLCNEVTIDTEGEPGVSWEGEGAGELPADGTDMVTRAVGSVAERLGVEAPPLVLRGVNRIPLERGLGSSAAAAVAGIALGYALLRPGEALHTHAVFAEAADLEGHADNAAPAAYGGFTIVAEGFVHRLDPHPGLRPVLLVPEAVRLPTAEARAALPDEVPRSDAVFNLGHASLAVVGFTRDPELLLVALHDRLHEDVRLSLVPGVGEMLDRLRRSQIPACVSGAGPSLLAFERGGHRVPDPGPDWTVLRVPPRATGVEVVGA